MWARRSGGTSASWPATRECTWGAGQHPGSWGRADAVCLRPQLSREQGRLISALCAPVPGGEAGGPGPRPPGDRFSAPGGVRSRHTEIRILLFQRALIALSEVTCFL